MIQERREMGKTGSDRKVREDMEKLRGERKEEDKRRQSSVRSCYMCRPSTTAPASFGRLPPRALTVPASSCRLLQSERCKRGHRAYFSRSSE